ncbi:MAG: aminotransferase class V-fold PLP-dependent enzyme [Candidatus Peregrinibacteria bacterium]|nr:aminotransferase class V-fold PLP-dependent enzyme [Candidatus Peregrinibacteria bacterium]
MFISKKNPQAEENTDKGLSPDFGYLSPQSCYLDSACQTLRPQAVIDAETEYYLQYNACGGRVKYKWGTMVDTKVQEARKLLLTLSGKREKEYCVAFTLNTTYGINLVLHQLQVGEFSRIVTSEIEHNSVNLPSITWAKRQNAERLVLPREEDGSLRYSPSDLERSVVLINSMSNIDGRTPQNLKQLAEDTHAKGGILLLDAAQGFAHDVERLCDTDFDAAFGSGHKMYGPSIGFIVIKRSLLDRLDPFFIGGGTVTDVEKDTYSLLREGEEAHAVLEAGLQNWGGILGLGAAVTWLGQQEERNEQEKSLTETLFHGLQKNSRMHLLNRVPAPIVSFHVDGIDAHQLALYLSEQDIMCRSGYFCCHSYLQHQLKLPPLLRVSLGLYNTPAHIEKFLGSLKTILTTL